MVPGRFAALRALKSGSPPSRKHECGTRMLSWRNRPRLMIMAIDHTCPVLWAEEHGLLVNNPVGITWCLSYQREAVMNLTRVNAMNPRLRLLREGRLSVFYDTCDWVNTDAKVMLVGITPGRHQATESLREARRCLRDGLTNEEALRSASSVGSFSGRMRTNLVNMLDGVGLTRALGIDTSAQTFDTYRHLVANASAISYPVFVNGKNYRGRSPSLVRHPVLRSLVTACLGARVAMAPRSLVVPLGTAAQDAVTLLMTDGLLDQERCLLGFPHPSGANGHRVGQYQANRRALRREVARWAATIVP